MRALGHAKPVIQIRAYFTFAVNERLTLAPWNRAVSEPRNCLPRAARGRRHVQAALPLLELARPLARRLLPESLPWQLTWLFTFFPVVAFVTIIEAISCRPAIALDTLGLLALSLGDDGGGGGVGVAAPPNARASARCPASFG